VQRTFVFPASAGVADVKAQYGAKGDGVTDDTAAIPQALTEQKHLIYLPNGTDLVSDTLRWGGKQRRQVLQGQSTDGTIIRLKDGAAGYQEAETPRAVTAERLRRRPRSRPRLALRLAAVPGSGTACI